MTHKPVDILLVNPPHYKLEWKEASLCFPLLYLGSWVQDKGYSVKIVDGLKQSLESVKADISKYGKDALLVGFTAMTPQVPDCVELSRFVKETCPDTVVVWGGIHATLFPEQTSKCEWVDYVVVGEGEETLEEIASRIRGGKALDDVENIYPNPQRPPMDLDEIPFLDYTLLPDKVAERGAFYINSSRGCPYRCTFCVNNALKMRQYRYRNPKLVLDEIEQAKKDYNINFVSFVEDNFFVNIDKARAMVDGLIERKINVRWTTSCRVDLFKKGMLDGEFLDWLKQSGSYMLKFGAESGSQRVLDFLKKDTTIQQIIHTCEECERVKITAVFSFMCALPTETRKERMETLKLIDKLRSVSSTALIIPPQPYRPYPGGELADFIQENYDFHYPEELGGWADIVSKSIDSSMSDLEHFPWVDDDPNSIRLIRMVATVVTGRKKKTPLKRLLRVKPLLFLPALGALILIQLRWKLKYFGHPWEYNVIFNAWGRFYR